MKEDNTPTVTARRRIPSAKQRLRSENAKRLKALNQHSKTVRQRKKETKRNATEGDPENHISVTRLPKIKKNNLLKPPTATSKFKKRQVHKSWLPTHLWHTKRAHISKPTEPLWRMAIPISPTEKSYRSSHRASGGRGCIAWDMSYMSTIGCQATEDSLEGMLKAIGFHGEGWSGAKYKRWKKGSRSAEGWVFERDNAKQAVAPVVIVWGPYPMQMEKDVEPLAAADAPEQDAGATQAEAVSNTIQGKPAKRPPYRLLIRIHPSAFYQFWLLLLKVAKMQRPQAVVEDLRSEIGSIEITGPGSTEALLGVFKPIVPDQPSKSVHENVWRSLAGLSNPASLPQNCLLAFDICDPRLHHPPKQADIPKDTECTNALTELMVSWPPDNDLTHRGIFSHKCRQVAAKSIPSQKAINRRKTLAPPGQPPSAKAKDPRIPLLLLASRPPGSSGAQGAWTVLLPWKWVDPIWRSLMYYPLSSGGTPRFGGLDQTRQIHFEHGEAWFPGDAPATEAGQAWERTESDKRFDEWMRRPASRRVAWETVDLGNGRKGEHGRGWACDWNYLLTGQSSEPAGMVDIVHGQETEGVEAIGKAGNETKPKTQRQRKLAKRRLEEQPTIDQTRDSASSFLQHSGRISADNPEPSVSTAHHQPIQQTSKEVVKVTPTFLHLPPPPAMALFKNIQKASLPALPSLVTIRVRLLTRGTPTPCARIYRLPSHTNPAANNLCKLWLALDPRTVPERQNNILRTKPNTRIKKEKLNYRGDAKHHTVHPFESLDHINYIPADAPPEYFQTTEHLKQVQAQAAALAALAETEAKSELPAAEQRAALVESLMVPVKDADGNALPACPDAEDLLGFVTSGSYNLAEGRGTAIGSIWAQRVVEGWRAEARNGEEKKQKEIERRRRLCVVRNAGESVGRLGLWELCT
jgi:ribonuclease P/MRP protein subunit POP1